MQLDMVTFDTHNARELATWWAERLNGELTDDADGWFCMVNAASLPVTLGFQVVDDPTPGKNRIHLDFSRDATEDRDGMIATWVETGATHVGRRSEEGFAWDTFADPHGNEFCIGDPEG